MSDFLTELNYLTRSKQTVEYQREKEHIEDIYESMMPSKKMLDDFDDNFSNELKSVIKNKAFMGEYTQLSNGHKKISGTFCFVKKYLQEYIGAYNFNGIKIENKKSKIEVPFEANFIVYEITKAVKFKLFETTGYKIYANKIMKEHIVNLLKKDNIEVYKIDNFPQNCEFVSEKRFQREYINRAVTFYYQIEY